MRAWFSRRRDALWTSTVISRVYRARGNIPIPNRYWEHRFLTPEQLREACIAMGAELLEPVGQTPRPRYAGRNGEWRQPGVVGSDPCRSNGV